VNSASPVVGAYLVQSAMRTSHWRTMGYLVGGVPKHPLHLMFCLSQVAWLHQISCIPVRKIGVNTSIFFPVTWKATWRSFSEDTSRSRVGQVLLLASSVVLLGFFTMGIWSPSLSSEGVGSMKTSASPSLIDSQLAMALNKVWKLDFF